MVTLVARIQSAQYRDGVFHARLAHVHLLEAPFECGVLLDVLAVLIEGRRPDQAQLAPREHRLEHVRRRDAALAAPRAHERVQFVDEGDYLPVGGTDFGEHCFESLLELATVLGPGDEGREVEAHESLVLEGVRHVSRDDSLGKTFHDGRLADAGVTDEDGVVLCPSGQYLADPPDLGVAADDRVEFAEAGDRGEVDAVLLERGLLIAGRGGGSLEVGHNVLHPDEW